MLPFILVSKELREDVSAYIVSRTNVHGEVFVFEPLGEPRNADSMGSAYVPHRRVFACAHDLGPSFVVLKKLPDKDFCGLLFNISQRLSAGMPSLRIDVSAATISWHCHGGQRLDRAQKPPLGIYLRAPNVDYLKKHEENKKPNKHLRQNT